MRFLYLFGFLFVILLSLFQSHAQEPEPEKELPYREPEFLYEIKCSKCHTLERIFAEPKSPAEWRVCVTRMREKSPLWITPDEGEQIIDEILNTKPEIVGTFPQKKKYDDASLLFVDRCTQCHSVNRILMARKTPNEWARTILKMRDKAPDVIPEEDIPILTDYLAERSEMIRDDLAAEILVTKCLVCHQGERILLERKSRNEWEKTVNEMREYARKEFLEDWFHSTEFEIIIGLLEKTQGIEADGF